MVWLRQKVNRLKKLPILVLVMVGFVGAITISGLLYSMRDAGSGPNMRTHMADILARFALIKGSLSDVLERNPPEFQKTFTEQWRKRVPDYKQGESPTNHDTVYAMSNGTVVYSSHEYEYILIFTPIKQANGIMWRCERAPGGPQCEWK